MARVTCLHHSFAAPEGPVQPETGQDAGECRETAPPCGPPVRTAAARVVRVTFAAAVRVAAVIKQSFDTAQTRGIVDDTVRGDEARIVANPRVRQRPRLLARFTTAPAALRTQDGGPGGTFGRERFLAERGGRRRLLGNRRDRRRR